MNQTFGEFRQKVAVAMGCDFNDFTLHVEQESNLALQSSETTKIAQIPKLNDGVIVHVRKKIGVSSEQKIPVKNQTNQTQQKKEEEKPERQACSHGPGGKCLNCLPVQDTKSEEKKVARKWQCMHGPNGKCSHCIDDNQMLDDAKHVSFDAFLTKKKMNCKNHPFDASCINCIPPSAFSYKMNLDCKNHAPFPKALCNACMPQAANLKRQEYRHIDYAEFMNPKEIQRFVNHWVQQGHGVQKIGYLYGYYCQDPINENGVRAIIEAIYEPPQVGSYNEVELLFDKDENNVNFLIEGLGFEKIGWIFTDNNHDTFLDSKTMRKAAQLQEEYHTIHPTGTKVSAFVTVVLRTQKDRPEEILPEVYMVSDQCQALERDNVFGESDRRRFMNIREPKDENDIIPTVLVESQPKKEIPPDFFIVNIAYGQPKNNKFSTLKHSDFPIENRVEGQKPSDIKSYLQKFQKQKSCEKYADFHLLLYLAKFLDIHTAMEVAACVEQERDIEEEIESLIKQMSGL